MDTDKQLIAEIEASLYSAYKVVPAYLVAEVKYAMAEGSETEIYSRTEILLSDALPDKSAAKMVATRLSHFR